MGVNHMSTIVLTSTAYRVLESITKELGIITPSDHTVAVITTACNPYNRKSEPTPWLEKDTAAFNKLGYRMKYIDIEGKTKDALRAELDTCDILFVAGGNVFFLLQESQKSGFKDLVRELTTDGLIYIGSSAGSVITCKDIEYSAKPDSFESAPDLIDTKGFEIVEIEPWVHIGQENKRDMKINRFSDQYSTKSKKVFIRNDQALIVKDGWIKFINSEGT